MPFTALGLNSHLTKAIREAGYTEPTPIQSKAIPIAIEERDLIGIAQTGTGKTAAFVLPILQRLSAHPASRRMSRALIVAPTRELVIQIEEATRKYSRHLRNVRTVVVVGGVGEQPQIAGLRAGAEIIIATPGRLIDLMQQGHVKLNTIEVAVLDEADRMLDMGFLPAIRQIIRALPKERQTLLFSATLSSEIEKLTHEFLRHPQIVQIGRRANPAETVEQAVYEVPKSRKVALLLHLLRDRALDSVLVFSRTKHGADKIARRLQQSGISTATLHSNRSQNQRLTALRAFKSGAVRVLVATDIAARGIDVEGISHVINFDFPAHPEDYVHRIGRTGRAQAVGDAISFATPDDAANVRALERFISRGIPRKRMGDFDYTEEILSVRPAPGRPAPTRPARPARGTFTSSSRPHAAPAAARAGARPQQRPQPAAQRRRFRGRP
ncbi:MAG TPA: DEAD/DEAH box helicase [Thermoanaerobaculia bacterium]|nr:DEAD/DEAH box helicase [Thermoanaerobaculia bacterium]